VSDVSSDFSGRQKNSATGSAPGFLLCCAAMALLALIASTVAVVAAQDAGRDGTGFSEMPMRFDIEAQPLADALYTYSSVTGIEILVPEDMLAGRRSPGVTGMLAPEQALRALLLGSGVVPRPAGPSALTLAVTPAPSATAPRIPRYAHYSAALQMAVTNVLCKLHETRPGGYRLAARLWVGPSGAITRVGFLGTTGDADRDSALFSLLSRVTISEAPPLDLPQPTTLVILPRQDARECGAVSVGRAP
jgi:hypothetical protein